MANAKLRVAYPTIPPYPTEHEVVARAQTLLGFLKPTAEIKQPVQMPVEKETVSIEVAAQQTKPLPNALRVLPSVVEQLGRMRSEATQ